MSKSAAAPLTTAEIKKTLGGQIEELGGEVPQETKETAPTTELAAIRQAGKKTKQFIVSGKKSPTPNNSEPKKEETMATDATSTKKPSTKAKKQVDGGIQGKGKAKKETPVKAKVEGAPAKSKGTGIDGFKVGDKVRYNGRSAENVGKVAEIISQRDANGFVLRFANGKTGSATAKSLEHVKAGT